MSSIDSISSSPRLTAIQNTAASQTSASGEVEIDSVEISVEAVANQIQSDRAEDENLRRAPAAQSIGAGAGSDPGRDGPIIDP